MEFLLAVIHIIISNFTLIECETRFIGSFTGTSPT